MFLEILLKTEPRYEQTLFPLMRYNASSWKHFAYLNDPQAKFRCKVPPTKERDNIQVEQCY